MGLSDARRRANKKWNEENMKTRYDSLRIFVRKGRRDELKDHAADRGESLNGFVNRAINETLERDKLD